jgi:ATP-dependent Clp protease protease subunit
MPKNFSLKNFFRQETEVKAEANELYIYGVIGDYFDEAEGKQLVDKINSFEGELTIHLNSPGGNVFDGLAVYNAIKARKAQTNVIVDGIAASIASIIAMAGDTVTMAEGSFLMIHNAWAFAIGDAGEMRKQADVLDKITGELRAIYQRKTSKTGEAIKNMMDAETWLTASEAFSSGFADAILEEEAEINNSVDLSPFNNVPKALKAAIRGDKPKTIREFENLLRNSGYSRAEAKAVASSGFASIEKRRDAENDEGGKLSALEVAINNREQILKSGV